MKKDVNITGFPQEIFLAELSPERKWYLYEQVHQHIIHILNTSLHC